MEDQSIEIDAKWTGISLGKLLKPVLENDPGLARICGGKVRAGNLRFDSDVALPYIVYRRVKSDTLPVKRLPSGASLPPARRWSVEMRVWSKSYDQGVEIAERVCAMLDGKKTTAPVNGLMMRNCTMEDGWENLSEGGVFEQCLIFSIETE